MAERATSFAKQLSKEDRAIAALERAGFSQTSISMDRHKDVGERISIGATIFSYNYVDANASPVRHANRRVRAKEHCFLLTQVVPEGNSLLAGDLVAVTRQS